MPRIALDPEEFVKRCLFPEKEEYLMYGLQTFRFFLRVLTEIREAKEQAAKYQELAQQHGFDPFHEDNWNLLSRINVQIKEMKKDIRVFVEESNTTCQRIHECRGDRTQTNAVEIELKTK